MNNPVGISSSSRSGFGMQEAGTVGNQGSAVRGSGSGSFDTRTKGRVVAAYFARSMAPAGLTPSGSSPATTVVLVPTSIAMVLPTLNDSGEGGAPSILNTPPAHSA